MLGKALLGERLFPLVAEKAAIRRITRTRAKHRDCSSSIGNGFTAKVLDASKTREAIFKNTEISQDHLTPEIRLHLLTPNCPLYHAPAQFPASNDPSEDHTFAEPFWSIYWPGGQALTRFVLDHGADILPNGTRAVLDLGAGCGAAAIAAKLRGAREVVANDIDPVACVAVGMNAALNNIRLTTSGDNLLARPYGAVRGAETFDVIFVGDLLYDEEIARILEPWLDQAVQRGTRVYLGDPGRHGVTEALRRKLRKLETYTLPENVRKENYGFDTATVWEFSKVSDHQT